jgi:hypothetical protein
MKHAAVDDLLGALQTKADLLAAAHKAANSAAHVS